MKTKAHESSLHDGAILKISAGMLITMASGLIGAVFYVWNIDSKSNANASAIKEMRDDQRAIIQMAQDIAVIKNRIENIEKSLPKAK